MWGIFSYLQGVGRLLLGAKNSVRSVKIDFFQLNFFSAGVKIGARVGLASPNLCTKALWIFLKLKIRDWNQKKIFQFKKLKKALNPEDVSANWPKLAPSGKIPSCG